MNEDKLDDREIVMLDKFRRVKKRTSGEIDEFVKILISIREKPGANPQLTEVGLTRARKP